MHLIHTINATIQVDDLTEGYLINDAITDLFDGEMEEELEILFNKKSHSHIHTLFNQVSLNIVLDADTNYKKTLHKEILKQLDEILEKNNYNQQADRNEISEKNPIIRSVFDHERIITEVAGTSDNKAQFKNASNYFTDNLISFLSSGHGGSLFSLDHDAFQDQLTKSIKDRPEYLISAFAILIQADKSVMFRLINIFSSGDLITLIRSISQKLNLDNKDLNNYIEFIYELFGIRDEKIVKVLSFLTLFRLYQGKNTDFKTELQELKSELTAYSDISISGNQLDKTLLIYESLIKTKTQVNVTESKVRSYDTGYREILANVIPYLRELEKYAPTVPVKKQDVSNKIQLDKIKFLDDLNKPVKKQTSRSRSSHPSDLFASEYLINTFIFILNTGQFPFWLKTDENEAELFFTSLLSLFTTDRNEIRPVLKEQISQTKTPALILLENLTRLFDIDLRLALLHILDKDLNYKLEVFQHYFIKHKNTLETNKVISEELQKIFSKSFSFYKEEIILFLLKVKLLDIPDETVKQLFGIFVRNTLITNKDFHPASLEALNKLIDENIDLSEVLEDYENIIIESKKQEVNYIPEIKLYQPGSDLKIDTELFVSILISEEEEIKRTVVRIEKDNLNVPVDNLISEVTFNIFEDIKHHYSIDEIKKYFLNIASNPYFEIPEDTKFFILRKLLAGDEIKSLEDTYFILHLLNVKTEPEHKISAEINQIDSETGSEKKAFELTNKLGEILTVIYDLTGGDRLQEKMKISVQKLFDRFDVRNWPVFVKTLVEEKSLHLWLNKMSISKGLTSTFIARELLTEIYKMLLISVDTATRDQIVPQLIFDYIKYTQQESLELFHENKIKLLSDQLYGDDMKYYNEALYSGIKERFSKLLDHPNSSIDKTQLLKTTYTIRINDLVKLAESYSDKNSWEQQLKYLIVGYSKEVNIPIRLLLADILMQYFSETGVPAVFKNIESIYYRNIYILYELFTQVLASEPAAISTDEPTSSISEYVPTNISMTTEGEDNSQLVSNAGLVICGPYISTLFQILDLLDEKKKFKDFYSINRAVFILNYLSYGDIPQKEYHLALNNVLCNVPKNFIYDFSIKLTKKEKDTCHSLLENICKQWEALKSTSPDGLRYNFLIREGTISFDGSAYKLIVAKKAYDILLTKIPWTIGTQKLPWMDHFLFTEWA